MKRREFIGLVGGAGAAWPLVGRAQQPTIPVIGFLHPGSPERNENLVGAFREGLNELGYVERQNIMIKYCWGEDRYDRVPGLVAELVRWSVAVIVVTSTSAALVARNATSTIPIVFNFASDPVALRLVASLSRPGGNITGITFLSAELIPKQLELLYKLLPAASTMALLVDPTNLTLAMTLSREVLAAARKLGLQLQIVEASNERELDDAFKSLLHLQADGLVIGPNTFLGTQYERLAALTVRHSVPAIYQFRGFAEAGGLMSYGTFHTDSYRAAGVYTGKILRGAHPGDLPVQQPNRFELIINLKAAKALGLTVPVMMFARANEVIE